MALHFNDPVATFIHVPKTAGTSVESWFRRFLGRPIESNNKHADLAQCRLDWPDLGLMIAGCRNPWDRAVSMFEWGGVKALQRARSRQKGHRVKKSVTWQQDAAILRLYRAGFSAWVHALYYDSPDFQDHWGSNLRPRDCQTRWLRGQRPDLLLRYENLSSDFERVKHLFGRDHDLPHEFATKHDHYSTYYDTKTRTRIGELYHDDIVAYDYRF